MARGMTDARLSASFPTHPKTKKLMRRLGAAGPWALVCLFLWARMNRPDGDLRGMADEDVELACDWSGDEGSLVAALVSVGFVDGAEGERRIHDWAEHQPWSAGAEDRKQSSAWAALCKRYGRDGAAERMPEYAERMRKHSDPSAPPVRPACDPHATRTQVACEPDAPALAQPQCPASVSASASVSVTKAEEEAKDCAALPPKTPDPPAPEVPRLFPDPPKPEDQKPPAKVSPIGCRIPEGWKPTAADLAFAAEKRPDIDAADEAENFRDFWNAKTGADARKADWSATWRNWIRKANGRPNSRASPATLRDQVRSAMDEF